MYKEKLIELLKTVPEIKEDLERKIFWTDVRYRVWPWHTIVSQLISKNLKTNEYLVKHEYNYFHPRRIKENQIIDFIWQLEERHLRMYCENKWYAFAIWGQWKLIWNRNEEWSYTELQLDNTKSFDNQTEEVYWNILEFLEK